MGKKDTDDELDRSSQKRLQKLADEWTEPPRFSPEKLTVNDLRIMLESFAPLRELIRSITAVPTEASSTQAGLAGETAVQRQSLSDAQSAQAALQDELAQINATLAKSEQQTLALGSDLDRCNATIQKLFGERKEMEQIRKQLEKQLQLAQKELSVCKAELSSSARTPAELVLLRQDAELAQQLGLAGLPEDDTQALVQMVAVLAQRDNLDRLWSALKERCESKNRAATPQEINLLDTALAWYNCNWQSRPYRRIDAAVRGGYDYERHLRSCHTIRGDSVSEQRLPGIADGSGKPVCKPLVSTA